MAQRTWRDRSDWKSRMRVTFELEDLERSEEEPRKERDDWGGTVIEGESWRQRRGDLRVKEKGLRRVPRLRWVGWDTSFVPTEGPQIAGRWGEKDGFQGEERGGVRPS